MTHILIERDLLERVLGYLEYHGNEYHEACAELREALQEKPLEWYGLHVDTDGERNVWKEKNKRLRAELDAMPIAMPVFTRSEGFDVYVTPPVDEDTSCPTCGEDGGTSCGMPNCGLHVEPQQDDYREHITDGTPCWCNPDIDYDPVTGAEVWTHKEPM